MYSAAEGRKVSAALFIYVSPEYAAFHAHTPVMG